MKHTQKLLTATILTGTIILTPAFAQSLDEVVVTAERREASVQDVPIAMSAFSVETLTEKGVKSSRDLEFVTPGLTVGTQLTSIVPFIRGVGTQSTAAGQDSGVSTYVDDVYYSSSAGGVLTLNNIERIEVLKGPQGTLFGRNATGGVMHIITKDPSQEFSGNIEVGYGNYDTLGATGYITGGLGQNVAADLAVYFSNQGDGYGTNLATGNDTNETDEILLRSKWLIDAGENTEIKIGLDYAKTDTTHGVAQRLEEGALGIDGALVFGGCLANGGTPATCFPIAAGAATRFTGDYHDTDSSVDAFGETEQYGASAHIVHNFGEIDLTSVTAYRVNETVQALAQANINFPGFLDVLLDQYTNTFTQEFRLSSSVDKLDWIAGVYFLSEDAGYEPTRISGLALSPLDTLTDVNEQGTTSFAGFGQLDYNLSDNTTLTGGLRYTSDKRSVTGTTAGFIGGVGGFTAASIDYDESTTFDELTWRLAVSHDFNDTTMGYLSYNRGFKSGLYNLNILNPAAGLGDPINPEVLDAFEAGLKTEFANGRARLNTSAFYYDYKDLQASQSTAGGNFLLNAAEATMYGGEVELLAALADSFTLNASLSLLETEYDDFPSGPTSTPNGFGGNTVAGSQLAGNEIPRSPGFTFTVGGVHVLETDIGKFTSSINVAYNDGFFWEFDNRTRQESYTVANGQITWANPSDDYYLRFFMNNITDTEYSGFGLSGDLGDFISAAPPRTYGVRLGVNF